MKWMLKSLSIGIYRPDWWGENLLRLSCRRGEEINFFSAKAYF
jgi:hypothetical protein